jgi:hypothetical protein
MNDEVAALPPGVPDTPGARAIEDAKRMGFVEVRPEDTGKPWEEQRLQKTPLGEAHERQLRLLHPEWFRDPVM